MIHNYITSHIYLSSSIHSFHQTPSSFPLLSPLTITFFSFFSLFSLFPFIPHHPSFPLSLLFTSLLSPLIIPPPSLPLLISHLSSLLPLLISPPSSHLSSLSHLPSPQRGGVCVWCVPPVCGDAVHAPQHCVLTTPLTVGTRGRCGVD